MRVVGTARPRWPPRSEPRRAKTERVILLLKLPVAPQMAFVGAGDMLQGPGLEQQCPSAAVSDWTQRAELGGFHRDSEGKTPRLDSRQQTETKQLDKSGGETFIICKYTLACKRNGAPPQVQTRALFAALCML